MARYQRMASERRSEQTIEMNPMTRSQLIDVPLLEREGMERWSFKRSLIILGHPRQNASRVSF
jgi:hypothetical protein